MTTRLTSSRRWSGRPRSGFLAQVEDRADVDRLLSYDEETAGGRMTAQVVTAQANDTVASALASIRRQAGELEDFSQIFVVDGDGKLQGTLSFKALVVNPPERPVHEVMEPADLTVPPEMDQEQVARLMSRYNVPSIAVVDQHGKLLGRVTFDDVIDVVEAETTEDMLRFGGVSADEDLAAPWNTAIQTRLPWLFVNLLTAFLAASVVVLFQDTLARTLALTAWMPIIAGMGGNAGTQALAVTVRRLALGQIQASRFLNVISKELIVGVINGLAVGVAVGVVALVTGQGPRLGLVVFLAMAGNLIVAGFRRRVHPASPPAAQDRPRHRLLRVRDDLHRHVRICAAAWHGRQHVALAQCAKSKEQSATTGDPGPPSASYARRKRGSRRRTRRARDSSGARSPHWHHGSTGGGEEHPHRRTDQILA